MAANRYFVMGYYEYYLGLKKAQAVSVAKISI